MSHCSRCDTPLKGYGKNAFYCAECNFPPKPPKVVQIATMPGAGEQESQLYALANDGTMWRWSGVPDTWWVELPPLPARTEKGD